MSTSKASPNPTGARFGPGGARKRAPRSPGENEVSKGGTQTGTENIPTLLYWGSGTPVPATIRSIVAKPGSGVQKGDSFYTYSYNSKRGEDRDANRAEEKGKGKGKGIGDSKKILEAWEKEGEEWKSVTSPIEGEVVEWMVKEGDVINRVGAPLVKILEYCKHSVQLEGLCALCGKDLTTLDYTGYMETDRANIRMAHDVGGLTVSFEEARRLEDETTTRLRNARKLSLIVDLDQTIVHATVDPTVAEWMGDETNPNYNALKDVKKFWLANGVTGPKTQGRHRPLAPPPPAGGKPGRAEDGCWYYIKMRPGLQDFLTRISDMYEMHVYTMGTRNYASQVCNIIDPDGKMFGGRILSRDESGSMTQKSLSRLFPCDQSMAVVIDDRADVWEWSPNLVKVVPYDFFVGIGDINASFLPKRPAEPSESVTETPTTLVGRVVDKPGSSKAPTPAPDSIPEAPEAQAPEDTPDEETEDAEQVSQNSALNEQMADRPLMKKQEALDAESKKDSAKAKDKGKGKDVTRANGIEEKKGGEPVIAEEKEEDEDDSSSSDDDNDDDDDERWAVLKDDDTELDRVLRILSSIHTDFYKGKPGMPSVQESIRKSKSAVLEGVNIVFSGVIPLAEQAEAQNHSIWRMATQFGARCSLDLHPAVTHLVADRQGTAKVNAVRRSRKTKTVRLKWLLDSVAQWQRMPEEDYLLNPTSPTASHLGTPDPEPPDTGGESSVNEDDLEELVEETRAFVPPTEETEENEDEEDEVFEGMRDDALVEVDWGDAAKEIDDALNETDDDEDGESEADVDGEKEANSSGAEREEESMGSEKGSRKRPRNSTPGASDPATSTLSPLSKRQKRARGRQSKLRDELSEAGDLADDSAAPSPSPGPGSPSGSDAGAAVPESEAGDPEMDFEDLDAFARDLEAEWS